MSRPKGVTFTKEHRANMSRARHTSAKVAAHNKRMKKIMKGRHPKEATASGLAIKALKRLGLNRKTAPALYEGYYQLYLQQHTPEETVDSLI